MIYLIDQVVIFDAKAFHLALTYGKICAVKHQVC